MNLPILSSRAAFATFAAVLLLAVAPSPKPAQPLALPAGNGAWTAQVVVSGGSLFRAKSYYLDSTGKGLFEYVAPGQTTPPADWTTAGSNLNAVAKSIGVSKPAKWTHLAQICCNKHYVDLNLRQRGTDGVVHTYNAGWPLDQSYRAQIDAATIEANLLRAYHRATNASTAP